MAAFQSEKRHPLIRLTNWAAFNKSYLIQDETLKVRSRDIWQKDELSQENLHRNINNAKTHEEIERTVSCW